MNRLVVVCLLLAMLGLLIVSGCASKTLALSEAEHQRQWDRINYINERLIAEDWDAFWLMDRPTYLSEITVR